MISDVIRDALAGKRLACTPTGTRGLRAASTTRRVDVLAAAKRRTARQTLAGVTHSYSGIRSHPLVLVQAKRLGPLV